MQLFVAGQIFIKEGKCKKLTSFLVAFSSFVNFRSFVSCIRAFGLTRTSPLEDRIMYQCPAQYPPGAKIQFTMTTKIDDKTMSVHGAAAQLRL